MFFQICERNFDIKNLKINFCPSDIKAIFNRLDINKDGKIHYWELKNFFKFRDYSRISALEDMEYRSGPNHYNHKKNQEKNLLEYKYPNSKNNLNYNSKNNKPLNDNSMSLIRSPSKNSCFNFNEVHNDIEEKIGNINKLISRDKEKKSFIENQAIFVSDSNNVKNFIGSEIKNVNSPNSTPSKIKISNDHENENIETPKYKFDNQSHNPKYDYNSTKKYLNKFNSSNFNSQRNLSQEDSKFKRNNTKEVENDDRMENNQNFSPDRLNKSKRFSNSKFGFATLDDIKSTNTFGIKINLEEEIFLQFLIDILQLNKEIELIKNGLARKYDFSIIKLFKIFQEAEDETEIFNQEKSLLKVNYNSTISELLEKNNYPNTFNITKKYNHTNKSFSSYYLNNNEEKEKQQSFNMSYLKSFPIGIKKDKDNIINRFAFKKTLNTMEIYPTLIELKLLLNRFNNKEADFR